MQRFTLPDLSPLPPAPPIPTAPGTDFSEAADSALAPADALAPALAASVADAASQRATGESAASELGNSLADSQQALNGLTNEISAVDYSSQLAAAQAGEKSIRDAAGDADNLAGGAAATPPAPPVETSPPGATQSSGMGPGQPRIYAPPF